MLREAEYEYESHNVAPGEVPQPLPELRVQAVRRLASIELASDSHERRQCLDTARELDELLAALNPGLSVQRQIDTAYCVKRTTQLLAGHEVDCDDDAIRRLGLWTILDVRWPLLSEHLSRYPDDLDHIQHGTMPEVVDPDLAPVFGHPVAQRVTEGFRGIRLEPRDIVKFTASLRSFEQRAAQDAALTDTI